MEYKELQKTLEIFVAKWKPIIIYQLLDKGTLRYSELQKLIPDINKRMLTLRLRELEEDGIINRKVYEQIPPKVEYSITEYGALLGPVLDHMNSWGKKHISPNKHKIITDEDNPGYTCQALTTINLIVGKWKTIIILELLENDRRFNEFLKNIPSINRQMLTNQLHELLAEGIIDRKVYNQVPPKVVYSLTNYGRTLEPVLLELSKWGLKHIDKPNTNMPI